MNRKRKTWTRSRRSCHVKLQRTTII